jgi:hypothetical protein
VSVPGTRPPPDVRVMKSKVKVARRGAGLAPRGEGDASASR